MSADIPAPVDATAVDPSLGVAALEANNAVTDTVASGQDVLVRDRLLFGLTEVPADVTERMKAHPDAGSGLLGVMLSTEKGNKTLEPKPTETTSVDQQTRDTLRETGVPEDQLGAAMKGLEYANVISPIPEPKPTQAQ